VLDSLREVMGTEDFENAGWLRLSAARWGANDDLTLTFGLNPGDGTPQQDWQVLCRKIRAHRLQQEDASDLDIHQDHVLLLPYRRQARLFFNGPALNAVAVAGELWAAHREHTEDWFPPETFFNSDLPLSELLSAPSGLLAEGPMPLLSVYADVLSRHGIRLAQVVHGDARRFDGAAPEPEPDVLKVLTTGASFVVAARFDLYKLSSLS
jgi:hypothetical protein